MPPRSPDAEPSRVSKACSRTARAPRTSFRTPPGGASLRWPRCTGFRAAASGSVSGRSRRPRFGSGSPASSRSFLPSAETSDLDRLEREAAETADAARAAAGERDGLAEQARLARERLVSLERVLAEQEGLPPAARALAERGAKLALAALEIDPGSERAVAAALRAGASAVLADDPHAALELLEKARAEGLGSLTVLAGRDPQELVVGAPGRAARPPPRRARAVRDHRRVRLRPRARRAVVRRRDRGGGAARARGEAPRARSRGGGARGEPRATPRPGRRRPAPGPRAAEAAFGRTPSRARRPAIDRDLLARLEAAARGLESRDRVLRARGGALRRAAAGAGRRRRAPLRRARRRAPAPGSGRGRAAAGARGGERARDDR